MVEKYIQVNILQKKHEYQNKISKNIDIKRFIIVLAYSRFKMTKKLSAKSLETIFELNYFCN